MFTIINSIPIIPYIALICVAEVCLIIGFKQQAKKKIISMDVFVIYLIILAPVLAIYRIVSDKLTISEMHTFENIIFAMLLLFLVFIPVCGYEMIKKGKMNEEQKKVFLFSVIGLAVMLVIIGVMILLGI